MIDELPVNIPGTNFKATSAQYNALLNIIEMRNAIQEPTIAYKKLKSVTNHPLNQILFGPPGTGKTYEAINYAISIIEDKPLSVLAKESRFQSSVVGRMQNASHVANSEDLRRSRGGHQTKAW